MIPARICNLCGKRPAGSREHLPGVGAANDGPVRVAYFGSTGVEMPRHDRHERVERDGFVVRTLCAACNSRTGGNYGTAYKEFVQQFAKSGIVDAGARRTWVSLRQIQPLRVIKQMTSMFVGAQGDFPREHWLGVCNFVLRRDTKLVDTRLRYFIYRNVGAVGRVTAFTSIMSVYRLWPPLTFCEISWPPLGIVFATERHPLLDRMKDITAWGSYSFRDRADFNFSVPQLRVATHWPLGFGSDRDAHSWSERDGVIAFVGSKVGDDESALFSVLTRRDPRRAT